MRSEPLASGRGDPGGGLQGVQSGLSRHVCHSTDKRTCNRRSWAFLIQDVWLPCAVSPDFHKLATSDEEMVQAVLLCTWYSGVYSRVPHQLTWNTRRIIVTIVSETLPTVRWLYVNLIHKGRGLLRDTTKRATIRTVLVTIAQYGLFLCEWCNYACMHKILTWLCDPYLIIASRQCSWFEQ